MQTCPHLPASGHHFACFKTSLQAGKQEWCDLVGPIHSERALHCPALALSWLVWGMTLKFSQAALPLTLWAALWARPAFGAAVVPQKQMIPPLQSLSGQGAPLFIAVSNPFYASQGTLSTIGDNFLGIGSSTFFLVTFVGEWHETNLTFFDQGGGKNKKQRVGRPGSGGTFLRRLEFLHPESHAEGLLKNRSARPRGVATLSQSAAPQSPKGQPTAGFQLPSFTF